ncbi:hypothetical protein HMPREF0972_00708 [Actinomyces sp. oral taxon 848 str. F0332]|nr:hypothetical protein HMPREF0972_00708 [Actinomyces sp. oral taxon 848 str. F0332]
MLPPFASNHVKGYPLYAPSIGNDRPPCTVRPGAIVAFATKVGEHSPPDTL